MAIGGFVVALEIVTAKEIPAEIVNNYYI